MLRGDTLYTKSYEGIQYITKATNWYNT